MDRKIAGLLGAVGTLASLNGAQAAPSTDPTEVLKARTFADLLQPIPDAMARLEALDSAGAPTEKNVQTAQFYIEREHHHHHHHHNSYYRRYREEPRVIVVPRDREYGYGYRHHHHHHHHNSFYRRYRYDD